MIKFRKIRYNLMEQNKTGKYFKYAIGEVVLVVIGILIALSINNWNEDRKDRIAETQLLNQLKKTFSTKLIEINEKINLRNNMILSGYKLLKIIDKNDFENQDSIVFALNRSIIGPTFNEDSKMAFFLSKLDFIENDSLVNLLIEWPNTVAELVEGEQDWYKYSVNDYIPFLTRNFQARNIYNTSQEDLDMLRIILLKNIMPSGAISGNSIRKYDYDKLFTSNEFENHLAYMIYMNEFNNLQSEALKISINKILNQINLSIN